MPASYANSSCPCGESDVRIQVWDNSGPVESFNLYVNGEVTLSALRFDSYGPFADFRFVDSLGAPMHVTATNYQITGLDGWVQHNIPQHPFTVQTTNSSGSSVVTDIAINQPIPVPYTLQRTPSPDSMGIIQVASAVGTQGFTVTLKRLA